MAHAVGGVEHEGPSKEELDATLDRERQGAHGRGDGRALKVPAQQGRCQIGGAKDVHRAAEARAREALPDRPAEVGLRLVVDFEMRRRRAAEALLGEDGVAVGGCELLGCYGPVGGGGGLVSWLFARSCSTELGAAGVESYLVCMAEIDMPTASRATLAVKKASGFAATAIAMLAGLSKALRVSRHARSSSASRAIADRFNCVPRRSAVVPTRWEIMAGERGYSNRVRGDVGG